MRAETIARLLGGRWFGNYGTARCPAHDDANPSLSIAEGEGGRLLLFCHAGCAYTDILQALRSGLNNQEMSHATASSGSTSPSRSEPTTSNIARKLWGEARAIEGTLAERYLRSRSVICGLPSALRFHPWLRHPSGYLLPAMIARVEATTSDSFAVHRTYFERSSAAKTSNQPSKAMLGPCKGAAVRLRSGTSGLIVCEGIETGLSLCDGVDANFAVWAALSSAGMSSLDLPERNEFNATLIVAMDGDNPGRSAGFKLSRRAAAQGWLVDTVSAPEGLDFNDVAQGKQS